ncbi:MAG: radical SAM/Cys-rich domain protein [Cytophagales bacterium]|nr:radical SAM/Cys-rich domain protein [Cytophagales bacterium]
MSFATLKRQERRLGSPEGQMVVLDDSDSICLPSFSSKLEAIGLYPLLPMRIDTLQINVGKMCNQVCKHCHVDAGPDRKEIMTRETMQLCLDAIQESSIETIDLTGGAPEMNPDFRWFVEELSQLGKEIIVRCNLTIILANPKYSDLPAFYKKHNIHVVSSLPYFSAKRTDAQRGDGVFEKSIKALEILNTIGYGKQGTNLKLDLVYNPSGAFLPGNQADLELEFKKKLKDGYSIEFDNLLALTNLPVSRYLEYLINSGNYEEYMSELVSAFNLSAAASVMCRNMISVGWNGYLYDCDFNQMLELKVQGANHISEFDLNQLANREIVLNQHCFGCTAGTGSSCGGSLSD